MVGPGMSVSVRKSMLERMDSGEQSRQEPEGLSLTAAIHRVLEVAGRALTMPELAAEINADGLYFRTDSQPIAPRQVGARVRRHTDLFCWTGDVVGLTAWADEHPLPSESADVRTGSVDVDAAQHALLDDAFFRAASTVDALVPDDFGVYAIRLREGVDLPSPFGEVARDCGSSLLYIGEAGWQTLRVRLLGNELRAKGNGTFFRSLGAVLGYRPVFGSLAGRARQSNYRFSPTDQQAIIHWINGSLEVNWITLPRGETHETEKRLIGSLEPLLNLQHNARSLSELADLREVCRKLAAGTLEVE